MQPITALLTLRTTLGRLLFDAVENFLGPVPILVRRAARLSSGFPQQFGNSFRARFPRLGRIGSEGNRRLQKLSRQSIPRMIIANTGVFQINNCTSEASVIDGSLSGQQLNRSCRF